PRTPEVAASRWAIPGANSTDKDKAEAGPSVAKETAKAKEAATPQPAVSKETTPPPVAEVQRVAEPPASEPLAETPAVETTSAAEPAQKPLAVAQRRFVTEVFSGSRTSHRVFQDGNLVEELEGKPDAASAVQANTSPAVQSGK
ncbi:MAG: hypothetical protein J5I93_13945, partial [Pirellulaceae bacterium]|nr:hypothetical protein [Pirellulaceae bacterium]